MTKLRLATIGTSIISDNLLEAAASVEEIEYVGTLSRHADTARKFTERHGGTTPYTSLDALCADEGVDAVYVASPNAAHFEQALACVCAGKHVLVEKPLCPNRYLAQRLFAAAELHNVVAMEAMRPVHDPAWAKVFDALPRLGQLRRASFRFGKYSSRFDDVLAGRHTNIFDARMATGALMDMGVYCVAPMVAVFGRPESIMAAPTLISDESSEPTGGIIDGAGSVLCRFGASSGTPGLIAELSYSKISTDLLPSQIEGQLGTITLDAMSVPQKVRLMRRGKAVRGGATVASNSSGDTVEELAVTPLDNNMVYELQDFVRLVGHERIDTLWGPSLDPDGAAASFRDVTLMMLAVTDEVRRQAKVAFPADFRVD